MTTSTHHVPLRDVISFIPVINETIKPFLGKKGHSVQDIEFMHRAWQRSIQIRMAICPGGGWEVNDSEEATELRRVIRADEECLVRLREEEAEILSHVSRVGFPSATSRANLLSQIREVEDRLHKSRMRLGGL